MQTTNEQTHKRENILKLHKEFEGRERSLQVWATEPSECLSLLALLVLVMQIELRLIFATAHTATRYTMQMRGCQMRSVSLARTESSCTDPTVLSTVYLCKQTELTGDCDHRTAQHKLVALDEQMSGSKGQARKQ